MRRACVAGGRLFRFGVLCGCRHKSFLCLRLFVIVHLRCVDLPFPADTVLVCLLFVLFVVLFGLDLYTRWFVVDGC